jgi:hypothetical protein
MARFLISLYLYFYHDEDLSACNRAWYATHITQSRFNTRAVKSQQWNWSHVGLIK